MISSVDHFRWRQIPKLRRKASLKVLLDTKLKRGQNMISVANFNLTKFYEKIIKILIPRRIEIFNKTCWDTR